MKIRTSRFEFDVHDAFFNAEIHLRDAEQSHWRASRISPRWFPPTDIFETDEAFIVRVEIAGMQENDFTIELSGRVLNIRGTRRDTMERRACHQMMIPFGEFGVEVEIPVPIRAEGVEAVYQNGFLRVLLPKAQPRRIEIETAQEDRG